MILLLSTSHATAEQVVEGFNGFKWGTDKQTILAHHREPQMSLNWLVVIDDTDLVVGGYKVSEINYYFDPLHKCNYELPEILHECRLIKGKYEFETKIYTDFLDMKVALESKYGTPVKEIKREPLVHKESGAELTNREWTIFKYPQKDSSTVVLWNLRHDRNYVHPDRETLELAGTQLIAIEYQSPRYAEFKKIKQKKKDF